MQSEWPTVKLEEVLSLSRESVEIDPLKTYKQITVRLHHKGVVLREEKIGQRIKSKQYLAKEGQFIISRIDARNGAMGLVTQELDGAIVTNDFLLYEVDEKNLFTKYFDFLTSTKSFVWECIKASKGTTNRVRLKPEKFLEIKISLPPLVEQKRIVVRIESVLAKIEAVKRLRTEAIKEMAILLGKSIEKYCFEKAYPIVDFGDLIEDAKNGIYKPTIFLGRGVPCIRMFNIHKGKINLSDCVLLDVTKEELNKYECNPGDIIFNRVNSRELVGKAGLVPIGSPKCVFESKNIRLRVDLKRAIPKYANYIINSYNSKDYFSGVLKQQCGQATLNRTHLDKMPFPLPLIETQQSIVAYLDSLQAKVDELKRLQAETEKEIEELVPSILDKAFKGVL
jgi:type I restriction enzyme S subunit